MGTGQSKPKAPDGYQYMHFQEYLDHFGLDTLPQDTPVMLHGLSDHSLNGTRAVTCCDSDKHCATIAVQISSELDTAIAGFGRIVDDIREEVVVPRAIFVKVLKSKPGAQILDMLKEHCTVYTDENGEPRVHHQFFGSRTGHVSWMRHESEIYDQCVKPVLMDLLISRCDVNVQDSHGQTALHLALGALPCSAVGSTSDLLIRHGGDVTVMDAGGRSPISMAYEAFAGGHLQNYDESGMRRILLDYDTKTMATRRMWAVCRTLCDQGRAGSAAEHGYVARVVALPIHIFQSVIGLAYPLLPARVMTFREVEERDAMIRANCKYSPMCDDY